MQRLIMASILTVSVVLGAAPERGEKEGHGGGVVVCYDDRKNISSVELLDLYELREEFSLTLSVAPSSAYEIATRLYSRLTLADSDYFGGYLDELNIIHSKKKFLSEGVSLEPTEDAFPILSGENCEIKQLANYKGNGVVLIDSSLWARMDEVNQAALLAHETVFKILRDRELIHNSRKARKIVAFLMSTLPDDEFQEKYLQEIKFSTEGNFHEVRVDETIRGGFVRARTNASEAKAEAQGLYDKACAQWQARVKKEMRIRTLYSHCGRGTLVEVTEPLVSGAILGYQVHSTGTAVGLIDTHYQASKIDRQEVASSVILALSNEEAMVQARESAWADYHQKCTAWKTGVAKAFKDKLIYALCEDGSSAPFIETFPTQDSKELGTVIHTWGTIFYAPGGPLRNPSEN